MHGADIAEGRHGAAQAIGLGIGETGRGDGQLHRLFLEQRHAERLAQNLAQFIGIVARSGQIDRLLAVAAAQIGMDHVALDRARPDDRHLDHQIVEVARPQCAAAC